MLKSLWLFFLLMAHVADATAQINWRVDYGKSSVSFKVKHVTIHHVTGKFREFTVSVVTPNEEFANARLEATIQVNSIDTGRPQRDANLKQEDFFHATLYPTITFKSVSVSTNNRQTYKIVGDLTMRGVKRSIELLATRITSEFNGRARFTATGALNRFDYGLRFNEADFLKALGKDAPIVGDSVQIMLNIELTRENKPANGGVEHNLLSHLKSFLSTLNAEARAQTLFPYDTPERLTWARHPSPRQGLARKDMSAAQRQIVDAMLKSVLSEPGFAVAQAIMSDQDVLAKQEEGLGAGYFWLAIYGEPGNKQWAWRLGGHHLSLHFTYIDNKLISCSPAFFGAEQTLPPDDPQEAGYKLLANRQALARALANSLNPEQSQRAIIAPQVSQNLVISEAKKLVTDKPIGLPLSAMTENQRRFVFKLITEYAGLFKAATAQAQVEKLKNVEPEKIYLAWAGNRSERGAEHYYRLQGPTFLIEYLNSGSHLHSVWRDRNDFGAAVDFE
jgi:polyisoprenoid-binding protein YceI